MMMMMMMMMMVRFFELPVLQRALCPPLVVGLSDTELDSCVRFSF